MSTADNSNPENFDPSSKVFYDLMANRVNEILLVSSPYDAFIMEEDGRLAERLIHEYRGLNLSRAPRLTWVSTVQEAFNALSRKKFDLVITMPSLTEMEPYIFGREIKKKFRNIPVFLLAHHTSSIPVEPSDPDGAGIDRIFVWSGNTDLLISIIKSVEDRMNVDDDTLSARVRVIIFVEDSPYYCSSLLPLLYRVIVTQTQAVMEESLNEEHRILRMRARPRILMAKNFEEAVGLYRTFRPYVLSVLSDVRFKRAGKTDDQAGFFLLAMIREESPDMPLLIFSSEEANRERTLKIPAVFQNKNSPSLHTEIRSFFVEQLGFGDFVFRLPEGKEVARAANLWAMEKVLPAVPDASLHYHATRNDFSTWLMARSEIRLASQLRPVKVTDFAGPAEVRAHLIACLRERRKGRQKGVVTDFVPDHFDPDIDFFKVGKGSLGGKARGLAFVSTRLKQTPALQEKFPSIEICVPQTLVISTEGFDSFVDENDLKNFSTCDCSDFRVTEVFLGARFPEWLRRSLESYLKQVRYPLAVRSSSLLEDAQYQPSAGIYNTYMIPNNAPSLRVRLAQLIRAIKLVYASTYLQEPKFFARSTWHRTEEEKMAVVIQQLIGETWGDYFYPAISGVAQSYNFYPVSYMKPTEGIAHIALGLGKQVVEGGKALRFSPKYPQLLPQFATVDDILENSQQSLYALKMSDFPSDDGSRGAGATVRLDIDEVRAHAPVKFLASTYMAEDHRIRDAFLASGRPVLTFARILKHKALPLPEILSELLSMGHQDMGCPVEVEFAVNIPFVDNKKPLFALLQIRPMGFSQHRMEAEITPGDLARAFCFSNRALGNGALQDIADIVFVKPDGFDPAHTVEIAAEISRINRGLVKEERKYLLIGPGRWGSADRWLGIPVRWHDISGVGAIVETAAENLRVDPSQGTHFFHNITTMGISYVTVTDGKEDFIDWHWLNSLPAAGETPFVRHVRLAAPLKMKIDGKTSRAALLKK